MKTLYNLIKVIFLSLILLFSFSTYKSQQELTASAALLTKESRTYTDNRILANNVQLLSVIGDVSKTTSLIALIECKRNTPDDYCDMRFNQHIHHKEPL